jgi:hypothetical protein
MQEIDLLTAVGIATFAGIVMQLVKPILVKYIFNEDVKKFLTIAFVAIICFALSFLGFFSELIEGDNIKNTIIRGLEATFISIGGYEGIIKFIRMFKAK